MNISISIEITGTGYSTNPNTVDKRSRLKNITSILGHFIFRIINVEIVITKMPNHIYTYVYIMSSDGL